MESGRRRRRLRGIISAFTIAMIVSDDKHELQIFGYPRAVVRFATDVSRVEGGINTDGRMGFILQTPLITRRRVTSVKRSDEKRSERYIFTKPSGFLKQTDGVLYEIIACEMKAIMW